MSEENAKKKENAWAQKEERNRDVRVEKQKPRERCAVMYGRNIK
jgi:hypothetical protein